MDFMRSIQQDDGSNELNMLLQALGQPPSPQQQPMGDNDIAALLQAMGMTSQQPTSKKQQAEPTPEEQAAMYEVSQRLGQEAIERTAQAKIQDEVLLEDVAAAQLYEPDIMSSSTGHAGADRVNANTDQYGVTASVDKDGKVSLTNIGADGKPTPQSQAQAQPEVYAGSLETTTSANLNDIIGRLQKATDIGDARGTITEAKHEIVNEEARIRKGVLDLETKRLGVDQMQTRLLASEALDQKTPGYKIGMGDSANTRALRDALYKAEDQARQNTDRMLQNNVSMSRLAIAASTLEQEQRRLESLAATKFNRDAQSAIRKDDAIFKKQTSDLAAYESLDPFQRSIISRLNPLVAQQGNEGALVAYHTRKTKEDSNYRELMQADKQDYARLALTNPLARTVVAQQESENTGRPIATIEKELESIRDLGKNPNAVKMWADARAQGQLGNKAQARAAAMMEYQKAANGTTKAAKEMKAELDQDIAMTLYQVQRSNSFQNDLNNWNVPELQPLVNEAVKRTGKADIDSVLSLYIGDLQGPEAITAYQAFKSVAKGVAARESKSVFGQIDLNGIIRKIDADAISRRTLGDWWRSQMANEFTGAPPEANLQFRTYVLPFGGTQGDIVNRSE